MHDQTQDSPAQATSDALVLYQSHLDVVTTAFWAGDFDSVRTHFKLPAVMRMKDTARMIEDWTGLRALFEDHREGLSRMGATDYHRLATEARFVGPEQIEGCHLNYLVQGGSLVITPYLSRMVLVREEGTWRAHGIETDIANTELYALGRRVTEHLEAKRRALKSKRDHNAKD